MTMNRRLFLFWILFFAGVGIPPGAGEPSRALQERHDNLIETLNSTSARRGPAVSAIYAELRGGNRRNMQETLREALFRSNSLILQGAIEALAMLGDPSDLPSLEALLATSPALEVKVFLLRALPAFALAGSERARINFLRYATSFEREAAPEVLEPLRSPPLTRRGRLDETRDAVETRLTGMISRQFDPIAVAAALVDDRLYGQAARSAVVHYVGSALGNTPSRWAGLWERQGGAVPVLVPDEMEEIRLAALQSLSDMEAEAGKETIDSFRVLLDADPGDAVVQAAFDAMAAMSRGGYLDSTTTSAVFREAGTTAAAENWLLRRQASSANLADFVVGRAASTLRVGLDDGVFSAIAGCLGRVLSHPPDFPDPEGRLAAATASGLDVLLSFLPRADITPAQRSSLVAALGDIGSETAVNAVTSLLNSAYCRPDFGPDAPKLAEAAVESLRVAATARRSGTRTAREELLRLLADPRLFPAPRPEAPPYGVSHMVLWRLQRLARSNEASFDGVFWRERLDW